MLIELDPAKDAANCAKHGMSLGDAALVNWDRAVTWTDEQLETAAPFMRIGARPVGRPKVERPKPKLTLRLDADVLESLRASGKGWQTRINALLREAVAAGKV